MLARLAGKYESKVAHVGAVAIHKTEAQPALAQGLREPTDKEVDHLKLIHATIDRMGRNSFMLKGWAVTLVAASIFLMSRATDDGVDSLDLMLVPALVVIAFWGLDAYYLRLERQFRGLYDKVRKGEIDDPFTMDIKLVRADPYWRMAIRPSKLIFYLAVLLASLVVSLALGGVEWLDALSSLFNIPPTSGGPTSSEIPG